MLLIVAAVHAHMYLSNSVRVVRGYPPEMGSVLDSISAAVLTVFCDGRSYPMFAALFGYGMAQIFARQQRAGHDWSATRKLLRRRSWWLLLCGFVHVLLLFAGDILGAYGFIGLLFVGMMRSSARKLFTVAGLFIAVGSLIYAGSLFLTATGEGGETGSALFMVADPALDATYRVAGWPFTTPMFAIAMAGPFLIGVWAARMRLLEEPERRRRLLRRIAVVGIALTVAGGAPLALITSRVWTDAPPAALLPLTILHTLTGYAGGFGYAAAIGLLAIRFRDKRGPVVTAIAACGQRSMTSYLLQSVAWVLLFAPYTLDLGSRLGVLGSLGIAVGTWLCTVVIAEALRRADARGPAEYLLRKATYGAAAATR
jgi:uncharacterized membrane protein YeiB